MKFSSTLLLLVILLTSRPAYAQSGQTVDLSFTHEGDLRTYQLYIPMDYDGSEAWPLVINLHGFGANTGIQVFTSQMNEIADAEGFLIAYPQGLNTMLPDGSEGTGWNADWWTGRDDAGALSKLIDHAWTNYEVDLSRVYATGLDNGGQMSLALACALNDRIAAVAGVAVPFTQPQLDNCTPTLPTPALLMHGTADLLTPFEGVPGFIPAAPDLAAAWAAKNNCDAEPAKTMLPDINTEDSSSVILRVYDNCDEGASVRFYEIIGGGHTWSGGPPAPPGFEDLLGNVNRDVSSSVEMWDFFAQFTHPDPREGTVIKEGEVGLLQRTVIIDGVERRYSLYVPIDFDGSEAWPLVVNLHGFAASSNDQLSVSDMNPVADTAHFLIAYPQGLIRESLGDEGPGWNAGRNPDLADDVGFVSALIDQVFQEFGIDLARVYATGLSQGGSMTYLLASDLGDRIAAIAPVAATMETGVEYAPSRPTPLLQIHGTADGLVPYDGSQVLPLTSVDYVLQFWLDNNGCTGDPAESELPDVNTMDNSTVTRFDYTGCAAGTKVVHYRVNGGGHTWPGGPGSPAFFGPTNQDFHASSEIWNFFARHEHPDPAGVAQLLEKTVTVEGTEREYLLYVPAAYDGSEEWPLVLNFHGFLSNPFEQIFASQMNLVADTADFLVAYPVGLPIDASDIEGEINPILPSEGPGWNVYGFLAEQDDLEFTKQIIQQTDSEFTLDNNRVYATGMSFGGIMTYYLACELNDQIAAFASVTGDMPKDQRFDCAPGKSVPILHIHGTEDPIAPYDGSLIGIGPEPTVQFWRDNNQCMTEPVVTPFEDIDTTDNSTVTLFEYDCADDSEVLFYRIDGGGHTWPNGLPAPPGFEFLGTINQDFFASTEIWNFFNRFTLQTTSLPMLAPAEIALQVFPNPFSDQLTFTFELPEAARVQLSVFNQLGQEVQTLADQRMAKGAHRVEWNTTARQLPAGMYYYRLRVGDRFVARPVVLGE